MKKILLLLAVLGLIGGAAVVSAEPVETGFNRNTTILDGPAPDGDCPGVLECNWDETIENGYAWGVAGVVPPDYGSFADCYDNAFVCEGHFYFTQTGYSIGQTFDVYLYANDGGLPGNVVCSVLGNDPGGIAFWPSCSSHLVTLNCATGGSHFLGFWGDWPGQQAGWFICSDEDGPPSCPVTNIAPGIGYPTGWQPISVVSTFANCQSLGICEWVPGVLPPENDTCDTAIELTCGEGDLYGDLSLANNDYDPGVGGCADGSPALGPDVVYEISLQAGDMVGLTYSLTEGDGVAYIVTDCEDIAGSCVAGSDETGYGGDEGVHYLATEDDTTVFLILDAKDADTGGDFYVFYAVTCSPWVWGACCRTDGFCQFVTEPECDDPGEQFFPGIDCDPDPCQPTPARQATWGQIKALH